MIIWLCWFGIATSREGGQITRRQLHNLNQITLKEITKLDVSKLIQSEINGIHDFFTDWVNCNCPCYGEAFKTRALDHMADSLVVTMPVGRPFGKSDFAAYTGSLYGTDPGFKIKVRDIKNRHQVSDIVVVSYDECQRGAKDSGDPNYGRRTTMVLRDLDGDAF